MQTKLSVFCDKIIEAGWLAVAIVTPLFFSWYSNRVFEASKVALLRSITLVMLAAWLIKVMETRLAGGKQNSRLPFVSLRTPLIAPVLFFVGAYLLSTATSIAPRVSFWGSYHRRQGLYVVLCYIAIFFLVLERLRTRRQLERLITVILLTSLPVSLYGIMQHYRIDPLVWIRGGAVRAESTLGNPILIGAYLIMVVPLTVWQLIRSFSLIHSKEKKGGPSLILRGYYLLLLLIQLICLWFTQSRGPLMGLMVGALFFFLILAVLRGQRGLALAALSIFIALLVILVVLNLPNSPLAPLQGIPYVGRLATISSDIMYDRSLIWQAAVNMITVDKIRAMIGYGPESMGLIFYPYAHPDWAARMGYKQVADRCHNDTLDAWVTGGLIGLAAYLALFGGVFYYGLKQLGLIANSRQRTFLIVTWLAGGFSGALIPWVIEGTFRWAGVGIPAGILLALVIYLMTSLLEAQSSNFKAQSSNRQTPNSNLQFPTSNFQILLIVLLSALVAHFVEIQFGIAITATRIYFWLYAALLAVIGRCRQQRPEPFGGVYTERSRSAQDRLAEGAEPVVKAAAETLPADSSRQRRGRRGRGRGKLQTSNFKLPNLELLVHSLLMGLILATTGFDLITHQFELRANGPVIFGLLFVTWLLGGIPILTSNLQSPISNLPTYILGSLLCFLPFIAVHAAIALPGAGVERVVVVYYAYIFLAILAVAVALMVGSTQSSSFQFRTSSLRFWVLSFGFWILSFLLIFNTNLKAAQADIYYKFGLSSEETGEIDKAIAIYGRAIQLTPRWDQYHASLGWAYGLKAVAASDANQRAALFEDGRKALEHAQQMSPLDPDIAARLGHVYWNWGGLTPDLGQRAEKWEVALAHYQQAVTLSPLNHGRLLKDDIVRTYLYLGETYTDMGKLSQAVEAYQQANELAPDSYESHKGLASVYLQLGRLDEALEEARTARDLAPEEKRPGLDDLIAQVEAQRSW